MGEFVQDSSSKYVLFGIIFILVLNAIIVDVLFFSSLRKTSSDNLVLQQVSAICPQSCVAKFYDFTAKQSSQSPATASAQVQNVTSTPTPSPTSTSTPTSIPTNAPTPTPELREYFVPLGQGNGSYTDWTVVPGMGAKITIANYGKVEKVYFEATVRIPTGNQTVYIRLYNASNQQNIVNSDLTLSSGTTTLLTSQQISLTETKDENLYQVQLKTQLGYLTYIDQARLRILSR